MLAGDDRIPDDALLEAMTQLAAALSHERGELVRLLASLVETQREMAATLEALAAKVEGLRGGPAGADPVAEVRSRPAPGLTEFSSSR
jgi:hypothetical protein